MSVHHHFHYNGDSSGIGGIIIVAILIVWLGGGC